MYHKIVKQTLSRLRESVRKALYFRILFKSVQELYGMAVNGKYELWNGGSNM